MITTICKQTCKCKKLTLKINLLKPVSVDEISSFMQKTNGVCDLMASAYWDMRTIQVNWGTSSEILTIHRRALEDVLQHVSEDVPF